MNITDFFSSTSLPFPTNSCPPMLVYVLSYAISSSPLNNIIIICVNISYTTVAILDIILILELMYLLDVPNVGYDHHFTILCNKSKVTHK